MSSKTKNLGLFKYDTKTDGKQVFSIDQALNENWDIIDEKCAAGGFNLFDTKITDHVLTGDESVGWALQGSLITNTYPDAVSKIKQEYEEGTTETLEDDDISFPYKKHSNGHHIVDISNKTEVDNYYNKYGICDFYILDSTNNRFYLPKTKWFWQFTDNIDEINNMCKPGLPNITGSTQCYFQTNTSNNLAGNGCISITEGEKTSPSNGTAGWGKRINIDASSSSFIYGNSDTVQPPASKKFIYYKVGNTVINESQIDVGNVLSDLNLLESQKADKTQLSGQWVVSSLNLMDRTQVTSTPQIFDLSDYLPDNQHQYEICVDLTVGNPSTSGIQTTAQPVNGIGFLAIRELDTAHHAICGTLIIFPEEQKMQCATTSGQQNFINLTILGYRKLGN